MDDKINILTIIALIVAVVAIVKLRSVLGRRTDDDDIRAERRFRKEDQIESNDLGGDNVVTLPHSRTNDIPEVKDPAVLVEEAKARIQEFAGDNKELKEGLLSILKKDETFDPDHFVSGACHAYELIVTAFAEGNRSELKKLLHKDVYQSFERAISEREQRGELIDQSFVGIEKSDILEAEVNNGIANVTMRFVSQLISATRDKDGKVISGDSQRIKEVTDIWTFSRDISTRRARENPNWKLVATQSPH